MINLENFAVTTLMLVIATILFILVLARPYLGIAFTISTLPVIDLLPDIPYVSSVVPLIGIVTIAGFLVQRRKEPLVLNTLHVLSLVFVFWLFFSNPQAAWFGSERNWFFTYVQLWVLLFLAGDLINTPAKQRIVMTIFSVLATVSAFYAILTGSIGEQFETSIRASGLTGDINSAARYFVVAMVFLSYLFSYSKSTFSRAIFLGGILITYLGVFFTVSRTGIILLFTAQTLIFLFQSKGQKRLRLLIIFTVFYLILWRISDNIFGIIATIFPTITQGTDTFGLRLNLWRAGWQMWLDHPINGVGIGMYIKKVGPYIWFLKGPKVWSAVAHNTYIQVLTETGFIGFGLFISMLITSIKNYWKSILIRDGEHSAISNAWLIALLVMLIGGLTKSDHADKMTWMLMGVSTYFATRVRTVSLKELSKKPSNVKIANNTSHVTSSKSMFSNTSR